ncbi:GNAT family N-acetyltransferase [Enterococcus sp. BWM-S5]|uniref:GNAT family N-acetyltransferase n=1 Tax=Enterococcus larvae TaxID=2794352 RepID=A0ABS4CH82_9ENTE|nr:GNAT family N-acetyltransferase [Enterococcus larvae]MBP1045627.1 GNAT family N-acetyltransferase [Enterococcus larvae]
MLIPYRKEHQKIAVGLLSFHDKMEKYHSLLNEIGMYEQKESLALFFWLPEQGANIQGLLGIEYVGSSRLILHDISLNPSYRGEGLGFQLLDELKAKHDEFEIVGTSATKEYLEKWLQLGNRF